MHEFIFFQQYTELVSIHIFSIPPSPNKKITWVNFFSKLLFTSFFSPYWYHREFQYQILRFLLINTYSELISFTNYSGHYYPYICFYELWINKSNCPLRISHWTIFRKNGGRERNTTPEGSFLGDKLLVFSLAPITTQSTTSLSNPTYYIHCFHLETVIRLLMPGCQTQRGYEL